MGNYIKLVQSLTELNIFKSSNDYVKPSIILVDDNDYIDYNSLPHDYSLDYLTFVAEEDGTFKFSGNSIDYSIDDGETWTTLTSNTDSPTVQTGDKIMFKAALIPTYTGIGTFSSTGSFAAQGNVMSLLYGDNFIGQVDLSENNYAFESLFYNCTGLTSAENISLTATTLSANCYSDMFKGCTSLTTVPELPATTLPNYCYSSMFQGCTSLTVAPSLPGTILTSSCYSGMFMGCTSLTTTPSLPATILADYCYQDMFRNCTSLTFVSSLPATTLAEGCYNQMFMGCTSLTTTPSALPAITLEEWCYGSMFRDCTSLTTSPNLPATTLKEWCYSYMFEGCTNLNNITCLATNKSTSNCTYDWVSGVAATGTFIKADSMTDWTTGNNGIPSGWVSVDFVEDGLILNANSVSITYGQQYVLPTLFNLNNLPITYSSSDTNVATVNNNGEITLTGYGTTTIYIIFAGNNDYEARTLTYTLTYQKANINPSVSISNWTYGETASTPTVSRNSGEGSITYTYSDDNLTWGSTQPTNAGSYYIKATISATSNYNGAECTNTFTISKANINPSVSISDWTYDETASNPSVSGNIENGTVTYTYSDDNTNWSSTQPTNAGTYYIKATIAATSNYNGAECTNTFTIAKITPTVVSPVPNVLTYNGTSQELVTAGSTNYGTLQYSLDNSNWSTSIPVGINGGSYTIYYRVIGDSNVNDVSTLSVQGSIAEKRVTNPTIILSNDSYTYSGNECTPTPTVKDGNDVIDSSEYDISYLNNVNTGTGTIIISDVVDGNYYIEGTANFTISKANINPSVSISDWTYGGTASTPTVSGNSGEGSITYTYSSDNSTWSSTQPTNAGSYYIKATIAATSNYNGAECTNTFTIAKANLNPTVSISDWTYGETASNPSISGNSGGGSITYTYSDDNINWSSTQPTNAGTYYIKATIGVTSNYNEAECTNTFTIAKANINPSVSISDWTYGETASNPSVSGNSGGGSITYTYSDDNTNWSSTQPTNAGTYYIKATISATSNYNGAECTNTFTISKANINPTVSISDWAYGDTVSNPSVSGNTENGTVTYTYSSDNSTWSSTQPTNAGTYYIKATISATSNYNGAECTNTFTIAKANINPSVSISDWAYGGTASNPNVSGNSGGGSITYTYSLDNSTWSSTQPTNIGSYYIKATISATSNYNGAECTNTFKICDFATEYLTFVAQESGTFKFTNKAIQYSLDEGVTWTSLSANRASPTIATGNKIMWKAGLTPNSSSGIGTFSSTGQFNAQGNVMSLLYGDNFIGQTNLKGKNYAFKYLFNNCTKLINIENIALSATTLVRNCYHGMFSSCTSLITAPELPATELHNSCYYGMFMNCTSLTTAPVLSATTLASDCYNSMFWNCTSLTIAPELPATTLAGNCYSYMFNGCSSLTQAPELPATTLTDDCYSYMFSGCSSLTQAPELPATILAIDCYWYMFNNCSSLTQAPKLPATTLAGHCYASMFEGCTSLTTAPELPATTLIFTCYQDMFKGCTNLNSITCLATNISASSCTSSWVSRVAATGTFIKADSMTDWTTGTSGIPSGWTVQDKNASQYLTFVAQESGTFKFSGNSVNYSVDDGETWTTLASNVDSPTISSGDKIMFKAELISSFVSGIGKFSSTGRFIAQGNPMSLIYGNNFVGQTSLNGKNYAFMNLFNNCTHLTSVKNMSLPATTLEVACYWGMFQGCTSLTTAPALSAITLAYSCYQLMFSGCTSLTTAPELPATTLTTSCYYGMFSGCTSLTTAPSLPATTLAQSCYQNMFNGCTNLNSITCLATDISATDCTYDWVNGVAGTGTFIKADSMSSWTTGVSGIPSGWTVQDKNASQYLTFVAQESGTFKFTGNSIDYSVDDGETWTTLASNTNSPTVQPGNKIMFKAALTPAQYSGIGKFSSTGNFTVKGNPMSLLYGDNFIGQVDLTGKSYAFYRLFYNCTGLTSAENISLPATTLESSCYGGMFFGCTSLITAPSLPATTLAICCYLQMFNGCSSLIAAPLLPATTLAGNCYQGMFNGCTMLTTAPKLPATALTNYCYNQMFSHCTSLTTAPELPATTLAEGCYYGMFSCCTNLNNIICLATNISAAGCTDDWVYYVAATGTFIKADSMTSWTIGAKGIPSGWTVQDAS